MAGLQPFKGSIPWLVVFGPGMLQTLLNDGLVALWHAIKGLRKPVAPCREPSYKCRHVALRQFYRYLFHP